MSTRKHKSGMGGTPAFEGFKLPEPVMKPGKPTKLSQEVFNKEYTGTRRLAESEIEAERVDTFGYSGLSDDNYSGGVFSKPMLRGMQALINSEWNRVARDEKQGWSTPERTQVRKYALVMLNNMVNRYYTSTYGEEA